jgi:hypothetical protein
MPPGAKLRSFAIKNRVLRTSAKLAFSNQHSAIYVGEADR